MAEIEQSSAPAPVNWQQHPGRDASTNRGGYGPYRERSRRYLSPRDAAEVIGLDPDLVAPDVWAALTRVAEEVETLRGELEAAQHRQLFLEGLIDGHPWLPVLNRRAWCREAEGFLARAESVGVGGTIALFYLANYEELHRRFGLDAAEDAFAHVGRQLAGAVRSTDKVGHLGGSGFVLLMSPASAEGAEKKIRVLAEVIAERPLHRLGVPLPLRLEVAVRPIHSGDSVSILLEDVDAAIRKRLVFDLG